MPWRRLTAVLLAAAALLLGGFGLASCGGERDEDLIAPTLTVTATIPPQTTDTTTTTTAQPPAPVVIRIVVVNGTPKSGIVRKTAKKGDRVVIIVTSDVADEVHLHGYDLKRNVAAGGTARIRFRATLPGRFEVELEDRGVQIADLTVEP